MSLSWVSRATLVMATSGLIACGSEGGGGGSGGQGGSGGVVVDCTASGSVVVDAPGVGLAIMAKTAQREKNSAGGTIGVSGTLTNGDEFALLRDGDHIDGQFDVGTQDASRYPYHLALYTLPAGWSEHDCSAMPGRCKLYFGLSGAWTIDSTSPFFGAFQISTLTVEENCWKDGPSLDTSGCKLLPGEMRGCFNVP